MLTELACRNANPSDKAIKLSDSGGLYLHISTAGTKSWRWKYRIDGKEKLLSIGRYPTISLKEARRRRDKARSDLTDGRDPAAEKREAKHVTARQKATHFAAVALAWHKVKAVNWSPRYAKAVLARLEANLFPIIGSIPIADIDAPTMLNAIRKIEARGVNEMAHRVNNHASDVFVFAIASGLAMNDPAAIIRKALVPTDPVLRPAMTTLVLARQVLQRTEARMLAHWSTLLASRLLALTAARPSVVRLAEIKEFEDLDGEKPIWRVPASKMKLTKARKRDVAWEFVIPLSRQAADVALAAISVTPSPTYLFAGIGSWRNPISDSTLSKLYREAGFTGRHVPHGWRATFSTIMNELASVEDREQDRKIIDLMLAHAQPGVEPIYNRSSYMPRRRQIAQTWADMLMIGLPPASRLLPTQAGQPHGEAEHERLPHRPVGSKLKAAKGSPQR